MADRGGSGGSVGDADVEAVSLSDELHDVCFNERVDA